MHMYMTSALSKNDMKAIGLQMALDLLAKKEKRDSITGLRTRTQPGRPEWGKVRAVSERCMRWLYVMCCVTTCYITEEGIWETFTIYVEDSHTHTSMEAIRTK